MNLFIRVCLLILTSSTLWAQSTNGSSAKVYYKDSKGKLLTEHQIDSTIEVLTAQFKDMNMMPIKEFKNKEEKADSIIYEFHVRVLNKSAYQQYLEDQKRKERILGKPLPDFKLKGVNGEEIKLADFVGKPMVINFWFTTCGPCIAEMPELNRIKAMPEYAHVNFIAITFDSKEKVKKFLEKRSFNFVHIVNARSYCDQFTTHFPVNLFIDKNGIVTDMQDGMPIKIKNKEEAVSDQEVDSKDFLLALDKIK